MADEPLWLQNVRYDARDDRGLIEDLFTEGVVSFDDFRVTARAEGANMSVDVQAGVCYITGDSEPGQGRYRYIRRVKFNLPIPAEPGNRRGDLIVARVYDSNVTGTRDGGFIERVPGTPAPSPQGAFVVPNAPPTAIPLAALYIRPGQLSITAAATDMEDRRPVAARVQFAGGAAQSLHTQVPVTVTGAGYTFAGDESNESRVFLAPPSGRAMVHLSARAYGTSSGRAAMSFSTTVEPGGPLAGAIHLGFSDDHGIVSAAQSTSGYPMPSSSWSEMLTGLSPGLLYRVRLAYRNCGTVDVGRSAVFGARTLTVQPVL